MPHNCDLPRHRYVWVHPHFVLPEKELVENTDPIPAVWYGISAIPNRMMGCHVVLETGATVLDLPLCALQATDHRLEPLRPSDTATWDCFGDNVEVYCPSYLEDREVELLDRHHRRPGTTADLGRIWFAIDFCGDGFSSAPEQHKHLFVVARVDGRLVQLPQDQLLVRDRSFTEVGKEVPRIRRQTKTWQAEG